MSYRWLWCRQLYRIPHMQARWSSWLGNVSKVGTPGTFYPEHLERSIRNIACSKREQVSFPLQTLWKQSREYLLRTQLGHMARIHRNKHCPRKERSNGNRNVPTFETHPQDFCNSKEVVVDSNTAHERFYQRFLESTEYTVLIIFVEGRNFAI